MTFSVISLNFNNKQKQALIPTAENSPSMDWAAHTLLGLSGRTFPALDASWVACTRTPPCTISSCETDRQNNYILFQNQYH